MPVSAGFGSYRPVREPITNRRPDRLARRELHDHVDRRRIVLRRAEPIELGAAGLGLRARLDHAVYPDGSGRVAGLAPGRFSRRAGRADAVPRPINQAACSLLVYRTTQCRA